MGFALPLLAFGLPLAVLARALRRRRIEQRGGTVPETLLLVPPETF